MTLCKQKCKKTLGPINLKSQNKACCRMLRMLQHHNSVSWVPLQEAAGGVGVGYVHPAWLEVPAASRSGCQSPGLWTSSPPAAERRWLQDYKVRPIHPFPPPQQQALLGPEAGLLSCPAVLPRAAFGQHHFLIALGSLWSRISQCVQS